MPFNNRQMKISPRYSPGSPFQGKDFKVDPRYTNLNYDFKEYKKRQRQNSFSNYPWGTYQGDEKGNRKWVVKLSNIKRSYSTYRFEGPIKSVIENKDQYKSSSSETSSYQGLVKNKWSKKKDMHPSAKYHSAMNVSNDQLREAMRKWNIFWVRMNRNKEMPDGVKEKVSKPKFDKKETEIWNE